MKIDSRWLAGASVAVVLLAAGCTPRAEPGPPGTRPADPGGKADVYGRDDRREVFDAAAVYRAVARSTAVVVTPASLYVDVNDRLRLARTTFSARTQLAQGAPLCATERFREQPAPGYCSAFLIAPDLVATAGHCVNLRQTCADIRFVFGFAYAQSVDEADVTVVADEDFYQCASVVGHLYDADALTVEDVQARRLWSDWAVVQLDRPVTGRPPLALRRSGGPRAGAVVTAVGHPGGVPAKVTGGHVVDAAPELYFNTDLDIYAGNSGSVVVDPAGLVEGIVIRGTGGASFVREGTCLRSRTCAEYDPASATCTGNHVLRIEPVLRFADAERLVKQGQVPPPGADAIPDGSGAFEAQLDVADGGPIRFVTLNVGLQHGAPADLRISLERDGGAAEVLFAHPTLQTPGYPVFSRTTGAFDGQRAAGTWRLRVEDTRPSGARFQSVGFWQLVIGIGEVAAPPPAATFIGSPCGTDADCRFDPAAWCFRYQGDGAAHGFCSLSCAGTCPDRGGFAPTFCTSLDGGASGGCVARAHLLNGQCAAVPGTGAVGAERFIGASGAETRTAVVCLPAGR